MDAQAQDTGGQQKKQKKANQKGKKADKKGGREKKPLGGGKGFLIGVLTMLCLLAVFGVGLWFNVLNIKTITIDFLMRGVSPYTEIEAYIIDEQRRLREIESGFAAREAEIEQKSAEVTNQLNMASERLNQANQYLSDAQYYREQLENTILEIQLLADTFVAMDPSKAGSIIALMYEVKAMAQLLKPMDTKSRALILQSVDPQLAANISLFLMD